MPIEREDFRGNDWTPAKQEWLDRITAELKSTTREMREEVSIYLDGIDETRSDLGQRAPGEPLSRVRILSAWANGLEVLRQDEVQTLIEEQSRIGNRYGEEAAQLLAYLHARQLKKAEALGIGIVGPDEGGAA